MYSMSSTSTTFYLHVRKSLQQWCLGDGVLHVLKPRSSLPGSYVKCWMQQFKTLTYCSKSSLRSESVLRLHVRPNSKFNSKTGGCQCRCSSMGSTNSAADYDPVGKHEKTMNNNNLEAPKGNDILGKDGCDYDGSLTEEELQELTSGDPKLMRKLNRVQLELLKLREDGRNVPSRILLEHWKELLSFNSAESRRKYLNYLFKYEMKQLKKLKTKENKKEQTPVNVNEWSASPRSVMVRVYKKNVHNFYHGRMCSAMLHNPPLVLDCSYDEQMTGRAARNCAKQISRLIPENRSHPEPFNLYLCNASRNSKIMKHLLQKIPTLYNDNYAINLQEGSFMDIFPKERLVYLTPYCRDELDEYSEDDIYIVGACVTKTSSQPWSFEKATSLGLKMRRLPLDQLGVSSSKSLTLNEMLKVMLDLRYFRGDWKRALQQVPRNKSSKDLLNLEHVQKSQDILEVDPSHLTIVTQGRERESDMLKDFELRSKRRGFKRQAFEV
ncbi:Mitochondrial ribonuclease P protein 1 [Orchesella cincta]|uniref:RNA (guanine-9-)-methyltransferase domain-containing protein 1 n=1 Tax=Orchesella cincta TaxID=48709 RepID=A0A1D2N0I4_ORCCI|nr:Mitochondrial ribonuclease P protein 1 [Orchesella cincta]